MAAELSPQTPPAASAAVAAAASPLSSALGRALSSGSASASSGGGGERAAARKKKKAPRRKKKSERTPLLPLGARPADEQEVHPLPWFRSPEWARKSPPTRARRRGQVLAGNSSSGAKRSWLCGLFGRDAGGETESDVELGLVLPPPREPASTDADGFKQCIQFLVGLIVLVAVALILLIIFQPKALPPPPHRP